MKKSIKKNYIYNLAYQIILMITPVITTPYLARALGAEAIGIYGYTISIATYFVLFGTLGISTYGQREIAFYQDDLEKRSKIFWELFVFKMLTMLVSIALFSIIFVRTGKYSIYYAILLLELFSSLIDISWLYQGMEEFKKILIRNVIIKIVSVSSIFIFIKNEGDLPKYIFIYAISNFFGNLSLYKGIGKYVNKIQFKDINLKKHIMPTLSLFLPQIAIQVYTVLDKTMLGVITNNMSEVGYYEQAQKIIRMALMIVVALGTVMVPRIANLYHNKQERTIGYYIAKSFNFVWFFATPLVFGIIATSFNFVPWFFGDGFSSVIGLMICLSFLLFAIGFNNVIGVQYLISTEKQKIFTISVSIGAVVNIILNSAFIFLFGGIGACISTVIAEFSILGYQIYYVKKNNCFDIKTIYSNSFNYLFSGIMMGLVTYFVGTLLNKTPISTLIQVIVGMIVYIGMLFILKDKFLVSNAKTIIRKVLGDRNEKDSKKNN